MARHHSLSTISNPLVSSSQLLTYQQRNGDVSSLKSAVFRINLITQSAGILLRLPQEVIATSIIILQRFLTIDLDTNKLDAEAGRSINFDSDTYFVRASSAATYLSAKQSFYPLSPRSIINVYALLISGSSPLIRRPGLDSTPDAEIPRPQDYYVSEGTYQSRREKLFAMERRILASLGFDTKVVLPYSLALTYLQALSATTDVLAERVISYLNTALLSPQFLYLTHQPNALAVAAVYLAAREAGIALLDQEVPWWEVFDVGREELGFLVLSLWNVNDFAEAQRAPKQPQASQLSTLPYKQH